MWTLSVERGCEYVCRVQQLRYLHDRLAYRQQTFFCLSELMDLFVAGRDQSAADQPNNLAEGDPQL